MPTTRDEQRQETATRVLACAGDLFCKQGFADTTIRDIAATCGVSVGTVMSVGDKNALLVASFEQRIKSIHMGRSQNLNVSAGTSVDRLVALFDPFVELFTAQPALARAYGSVLVAGGYESITFTELSGALISEIEAVLQGTATAEEGVSALAESIYFAYIGRLFTWQSHNDRDSAELAQDLRRIVAAICRTMEPKK